MTNALEEETMVEIVTELTTAVVESPDDIELEAWRAIAVGPWARIRAKIERIGEIGRVAAIVTAVRAAETLDSVAEATNGADQTDSTDRKGDLDRGWHERLPDGKLVENAKVK